MVLWMILGRFLLFQFKNSFFEIFGEDRYFVSPFKQKYSLQILMNIEEL